MITVVFVAIAAAFFPVGRLAEVSNSGTLFAFFMVSIAVMMLRKADPHRHRPFRTPAVWIIAPLSIIGCVGLSFSLPLEAKLVLPVWGGIGLVVYFLYGSRRSNIAPGHLHVPQHATHAPP